MTGPEAAFTNQEIAFTITVTNLGMMTAADAIVMVQIPSKGSFLSSSPAGVLSDNLLTVQLGNLDARVQSVVSISWQTPDSETTLTTIAPASADNASDSYFRSSASPSGHRHHLDGQSVFCGHGST
jgi:uncharacterized repeat protein (TIGR01451 family)